jgi:hypothetical protein
MWIDSPGLKPRFCASTGTGKTQAKRSDERKMTVMFEPLLWLI